PAQEREGKAVFGGRQARAFGEKRDRLVGQERVVLWEPAHLAAMLDFEKVLIVLDHGVRKAGELGDIDLVAFVVGIADANARAFQDDALARPIALGRSGHAYAE